MTHASLGSCERWDALLPEYVDACLRGGAALPVYAGLRRHLSHCVTCAMLVAETVSIMRWREAEEPFNQGVLPPPPFSYLHRGDAGGNYRARPNTRP